MIVFKMLSFDEISDCSVVVGNCKSDIDGVLVRFECGHPIEEELDEPKSLIKPRAVVRQEHGPAWDAGVAAALVVVGLACGSVCHCGVSCSKSRHGSSVKVGS